MVKVVKEYDERRNEIIEVATGLFLEKGYESCSVNDILNAIGIAKGTFYYYFKSKEAVLNAGVEQLSEMIFMKVQEIAKDKTCPHIDRMVRIMMAIKLNDKSAEVLIQEMHKINNALLHQKTLVSILKILTPIFTEIIEDGNREGLFNCPYPEQCVQILLSSSLTLLDEGIFNFDREKEKLILRAIFFSMEKMLGLNNDELSSKMIAFYDNEGNDLQ